MSSNDEQPMPKKEKEEAGKSAGGAAAAGGSSEHLNIKVTDADNEIFFKIRKETPLRKLMDAFCNRQGTSMNSVRFVYEGERVQPNNTPEELEMEDGDTIEVMAEQLGGCLY